MRHVVGETLGGFQVLFALFMADFGRVASGENDELGRPLSSSCICPMQVATTPAGEDDLAE